MIRVRAYSEKSHQMFDDTKDFQPIILNTDSAAAERITARAKSFVESLQKLDELYEAQFSEKIQDHQALLEVEDFEYFLKEKFVQAKGVSISGVQVKLEKLIEIIEMPDFSELIKAQEEARSGLQYMKSCQGLSLSLDKFRKGDSWAMPKKLWEEALFVHTEKTSTIEQNYALQAARKFLEAIDEFNSLGFGFSESAGIENNVAKLSRAILKKDEKGVLDVNPRLLYILRLKK